MRQRLGFNIAPPLSYPDHLHALLARFAPVLGGEAPPLPLPLVKESSVHECGEWGWSSGTTELTSSIVQLEGDPRQGEPFDMKQRLTAPAGSVSLEVQALTISHPERTVVFEVDDLAVVPSLLTALRDQLGPMALRNSGYGDRWGGTLSTIDLLMDAGHDDVARPLLEDAVCWALETGAAQWQTAALFETAAKHGVPTSAGSKAARSRGEVFILGVSAGLEGLQRYLDANPDHANWALLEAARTDVVECVEWLLDEHIPDAGLSEALDVAARAGSAEVVGLLLDRGAATSDDAVLLDAIRWTDGSAIDRLAASAANLEEALAMAVSESRPAACEALLRAGAMPTSELLERARELKERYNHSHTYRVFRVLDEALAEPVDPAPVAPVEAVEPQPAYYPEPGPGPDTAPTLGGREHLGTFQCDGALSFCELTRFGQQFDQQAFDAATSDLSTGDPSYEVGAIEVGWISVMDGLWDVYVDPRPGTSELILQHRNNAEEPATHLRHIGGLTIAYSPTVCVCEEASWERAKKERLFAGMTRGVNEVGCVAQLDEDELYEWVTFTGHAGGQGLIRKLVIQAGVGE